MEDQGIKAIALMWEQSQATGLIIKACDGGSLQVWGCISAQEVGHWIINNSLINAMLNKDELRCVQILV